MAKIKRFRIIAGPNGSGKTSLYQALLKMDHPRLGIYLNADLIESTLRLSGIVAFSNYSVIITEDEAKARFCEFLEGRETTVPEDGFRIQDNFLVILNKGAVDSYFAGFVTELIRDKMLESGVVTITMETVMSHESKLGMIQRARELGYRIYLYYIATRSPLINQERVKARTEKGGHDVPQDKIVSRFGKSLDLLHSAVLLSDRAFLIDNSTKSNELVAEYDREANTLNMYSEDCPDWVSTYFLEKNMQEG